MIRVPFPLGARRDAADIVSYYRNEGGADLALRFSRSLQNAIGHIRTHPESGSLRFAAPTGIAGLRVWPLAGFPYLIFYSITGSDVLILRILHTARDVPASLRP